MCQLTGVKLLTLWVMEKLPLPAVCDFRTTLGKVTGEEKDVWNWSFRNVEGNVWCLQIQFFFCLGITHVESTVVLIVLFTICKSGTSGWAEMYSVCLGYRLHHLYLCFMVLFPPMKIKIRLAWAEMFCRVCGSWGNFTGWWVPWTVFGIQHGLCDIWWEGW